ncbi:MAG: hypothetical protein RIT14_2665 [Pseudomonadota bacterium]
MSRLVATGFGLGLLRPAPGTWGSAGALVLGIGIDRLLGFPALVLATAAAVAVGFWACARVCGPGEDPSEVVIDEVAGQWIAMLFPAAAVWAKGLDVAYPGWIAAFVFFRLFDIWKPWLVGRADRRGDAAGVMLDDLWAGLFAGLAVIVTGVAYHAVILGV